MDRMTPSPTLYARRRAAVARALKAAGGGVALLPTAPEQSRNRDSHYPYRHDSYFYYLTGFDEPESWLLIDASGKSTLLCRPKNLEREIWGDDPPGADALRALVAQTRRAFADAGVDPIENLHGHGYRIRPPDPVA